MYNPEMKIFMKNDIPKRPLSEKVLRRHTELLDELLPLVDRLVLDEKRPADVLLAQYFRTHKEFGSRDRRFLSQAIFSFFRWRGWSVEKLKLPLKEASLLGVALDNETLSESFLFLEKQAALPLKLEILLDKKTLDEKMQVLNDAFKEQSDFQPLQIIDLVPEGFQKLTNPDKLEKYIVAFQARPLTWIRARNNPDDLLEILNKETLAQAHPFVATALSIDGGKSLVQLLPKQDAKYVVQDVASQCVAHVCNPQKGEDWWDTCAGAGGKALHLNDLMQQEGKVLATDIRPESLQKLKKRARKYGIRTIRIQPHNMINDDPFKKTFDGVLVDAPCSGWGTWARNPDARWRSSNRNVMQAANRQLKILDNARYCVKPGGVLVYAVCTETGPETEEVVMLFLEKNTKFKLDPFPSPLTGEMTSGMLQIEPWEGDGMFIARFIRTDDA